MELFKEPNYVDPDWSGAGRVHDWRNYISDELQAIWQTFSEEQKRLIAESAEVHANNEDWD